MSYLEAGEYQLPPDLTGALARIHRLVSEGYRWWKPQTVPRDELPKALAKLHAKHFILLDTRARQARKEAGLPVAQVVVSHRVGEYKPGKPDTWLLMLLATKKLPGEEMHHIAKKPPRWLGRGTAFQMAKDARGKWQWEIAPEAFAFYTETVVHHIARRDWGELARFFHSELDRLPNLKGINAQRLSLLKRVEKAWGDLYLRNAGPRRKKPDWMKELKERWRTPLSIRRVKTKGPTVEEVLSKLMTE